MLLARRSDVTAVWDWGRSGSAAPPNFGKSGETLTTTARNGVTTGTRAEHLQEAKTLPIFCEVFARRRRKTSKKMSRYTDVPLGIIAVQKVSDCCSIEAGPRRALLYKVSVLLLTYMSYMFYHMSRKPLSVVKNVFHQNCSGLTPGADDDANVSTWCDWAPFDRDDYSTLFGTLDSAFLFAYSAGMFVSGIIAERVNLRYFLSLGMIFSGVFCYLFGLARTCNIHAMWYFILMQVLGGIVQTTGWPGVVTVVGNWFGEGNRGLIFGIWNSHTSVGNILGSLVAAAFVEQDWGLSFIVPGAIIAGGGFLIFLFMVENPSHVGCPRPGEDESEMRSAFGYQRIGTRVTSDSSSDEYSSGEEDSLLGGQEIKRFPPNETVPIAAVIPNETPISFWSALKIPGVVEYSLSLFFAKLVSYTFLYWLPLYISASTTLGATLSADVSTLFDVGGIIGGIAAGVISDYTGMSAVTCAGMLVVAIPLMFVYDEYGSVSVEMNIFLLIVVGILVNGPYALITTAVSADLGTHESLKGSSRALATVTAIIDGTGSIGAAVGPLLAGVIYSYGWESVFYMLMASDVLALLFLVRLVIKEFTQRRRRTRQHIG
ncbi:glucose-6-phosphate exchanger SLC37A2 isoform X1 [Schistocerca serialis cubense]|uniref:glucose-6-phosphate exchanger SLC37A2 isoform X1 n=2 Tax=Schistocerca serialis cubense TaxID=2023355 RepID=UPI00214EBDDE|nr:glucose-6-phosphate exchanger SLC37A2 isoform X1 [Schistocerca serialis cubense]